ncbi:hypothetical protein HDU67_008357 [Dinochytrium kinnereticum]|nr:hypothetical protein HDU67_008357 [Dinochytrium kinnereticum]
MSIQQYGKKFPLLLRTPSPRGQVELLETIGKGNYGYVYKGRLISTNEYTAVKVVFLKEEELKETLLEMEILKACNHHNITRYMGLFLKGLDLWICMELCTGGALDSIYRSIKKPLTEDQIASLMYESVVGLDYLHTQVALIHRDIKAGNLLLTDDGQLKIADFGVSAKLNSTSGRARTFIGTPYWMAPEVIRCDPDSSTSSSASYDTKADVWSIGITAIEIADKNPPLSDIHPMRALHLIPDSNELMLAKPKNWSKQFVDFISVCLTKDPVKRPSMAQLLNHPFMVKARDLNRQKIMADLVAKAKLAKERKKAGLEYEDDEEEEEKKEEVPVKVIAETIKQAKTVAAEPISIPAPQAAEAIAASIASEFPSFSIEGDPSRAVFNPVSVGGIMRFTVLSGDLLDSRFALLGAEKGLYFYDLEKPMSEPVPLIRNTRFRQIEVVSDYGVMIALSGKHDHIRQYKLSSIRKLILYLLGMSTATQLAKINLNNPINSNLALAAANKGPVQPTDEMYNNLHDTVEDETVLVSKWSSDYIKIPNTKDSKSFLIQRTESSIYMGALLRQDVILFEWAKDPYLKFMKLKAFWLPETPKFMNLLNDGLVIREVYMAYAREANLVNVDDSRVTEIDVHREFSTKCGGGRGARWQAFAQIPFSDAKRKELRTLSRPTTTINRKLAAVHGPHANQSARVDRYFLATYHRLTRVVDLSSQPMMGSGVGGWKDGVTWLEPPTDFILRPIDHVVAMGKNSIEVADWRSAQIQQVLKIDSGATLKAVSTGEGSFLVLVERRKGCVLYLMKEKVKEKVSLDPPTAESKLEAEKLDLETQDSPGSEAEYSQPAGQPQAPPSSQHQQQQQQYQQQQQQYQQQQHYQQQQQQPQDVAARMAQMSISDQQQQRQPLPQPPAQHQQQQQHSQAPPPSNAQAGSAYHESGGASQLQQHSSYGQSHPPPPQQIQTAHQAVKSPNAMPPSPQSVASSTSYQNPGPPPPPSQSQHSPASSVHGSLEAPQSPGKGSSASQPPPPPNVPYQDPRYAQYYAQQQAYQQYYAQQQLLAQQQQQQQYQSDPRYAAQPVPGAPPPSKPPSEVGRYPTDYRPNPNQYYYASGQQPPPQQQGYYGAPPPQRVDHGRYQGQPPQQPPGGGPRPPPPQQQHQRPPYPPQQYQMSLPRPGPPPPPGQYAPRPGYYGGPPPPPGNNPAAYAAWQQQYAAAAAAYQQQQQGQQPGQPGAPQQQGYGGYYQGQQGGQGAGGPAYYGEPPGGQYR